MRCKACNVILEDGEATKSDKNGDYYDLCNRCFSVSTSAVWELEEGDEEVGGTMSQDDWLTLEDNYAKMYLSITKDN